MGGSCERHGDRIGDVAVEASRQTVDRLARPSRLDGGEERVALRAGLETAFARTGQRQSQLVDLGQRKALASGDRAPGGGQQDGIIPGAAMGEQIRDPALDSGRIGQVTRRGGAFNSVAERETPHRERGRQPDEQRQRPAPNRRLVRGGIGRTKRRLCLLLFP
jgi:hypothetical protein